MFIVNENEREYRFGESGPKYLLQGPRVNFAIVRFLPGESFKNHLHNKMEENFFVLEGEIDIVVDGKCCHLTPGQLLHIEPGEAHFCINRSEAPVRMIATLGPYQEVDKVELPDPPLA